MQIISEDEITFGIRIDLLIAGECDEDEDIELCSIEFKKSNESESILKYQQNKNLRINSCILNDINLLTRNSIPAVYLDFSGISSYIVQLFRFENCFVSHIVLHWWRSKTTMSNRSERNLRPLPSEGDEQIGVPGTSNGASRSASMAPRGSEASRWATRPTEVNNENGEVRNNCENAVLIDNQQEAVSTDDMSIPESFTNFAATTRDFEDGISEQACSLPVEEGYRGPFTTVMDWYINLVEYVSSGIQRMLEEINQHENSAAAVRRSLEFYAPGDKEMVMQALSTFEEKINEIKTRGITCGNDIPVTREKIYNKLSIALHSFTFIIMKSLLELENFKKDIINLYTWRECITNVNNKVSLARINESNKYSLSNISNYQDISLIGSLQRKVQPVKNFLSPSKSVISYIAGITLGIV